MIIGILSDSHDNLSKLKKAVALFNSKHVNLVIHAGDYVAPFAVGILENNLKCEYLGVFGNNDGEKEGLISKSKGKIKGETLEIERFGKKILVAHDLGLGKINYSDYDIVIYGHTHELKIERKGSTWLINPGECGGWLTGKSTVVILDLISNVAKEHRI